MNMEVLQDYPIYARTAYAIMCCERYVTAVHPDWTSVLLLYSCGTS